TIVSHAPAKPDRTKETEAQRKTRTTFRAATQWAKAQLTIPERRDYYIRLARKWNLTNAYTAAIKDYMCNAGKMLKGSTHVSIIDQTGRKKTASVNERSIRTAPAPLASNTPKPNSDISIARFLNLARHDFTLDELRMHFDLGDRSYDRHLHTPVIGNRSYNVSSFDNARIVTPLQGSGVCIRFYRGTSPTAGSGTPARAG